MFLGVSSGTVLVTGCVWCWVVFWCLVVLGVFGCAIMALCLVNGIVVHSALIKYEFILSCLYSNVFIRF